jgi:hypothetical protein
LQAVEQVNGGWVCRGKPWGEQTGKDKYAQQCKSDGSEWLAAGAGEDVETNCHCSLASIS